MIIRPSKSQLAVTSRCHLERKFYTKLYQIDLRFYTNGGLDGSIIQFVDSLRLEKDFQGVYTSDSSLIRFSFFSDWRDPNLFNDNLTAYSGTILNYSKVSECLLLRWLKVCDTNLDHIGTIMESATDLLFDCPEKDPVVETKKIIGHIPPDIFFSINAQAS